MKLLKIEIKGIAKHEDTTIVIDKPLTIIFGDVEQGKTTILNVVRWGLGCIVPDKVIKEGCTEGDIFLTFDNATSHRSFYIGKDGSEVARPLEYIEGGRVVKEPIKYLKTKINPFLLNNEYFMQMSTTEQMKFFVALFGIDTSAENKLLATTEESNKTLRIEIKSIGDIVPVMVAKPDLDALKAEKSKIDEANLLLTDAFKKAERERSERTQVRMGVSASIEDYTAKINRLKAEIKEAEGIIAEKRSFMEAYTELPEPTPPILAPTTEIEEKISNAKADELLYDKWKLDVQRLKAKTDKEKELKDGEELARNTRAAKIAKLESFSDKTGIEGLKFVEGGYTYQGTAFDMLSTSARMDLSDKLSALFPSDFDIDLIDRAESLGRKNLINLGEIAAKGKRTIIATVVSDELSIDDANIGVFKIEDGTIV